MKKKLLITLGLLLLITSSISIGVFATPTLKLMINSKASKIEIKVIDKINYVPLNTFAASIGYDITPNTKTNTINVSIKKISPTPTPKVTSTQNANLSDVVIGFNNKAPTYNASNVQLIFNNIGGYIVADLELTGNNEVDNNNIVLTSSFVAKSPAVQIFINIKQSNYNTGFYDISRDNVENFIKNTISLATFKKSWKWIPTTPQPSTPSAFDSSKTTYMELYSNDGKTYLGKLTSNEYDSDSIFNDYGSYGGKYSSKSIYNEYGTYGGKYSAESPFNAYTSTPPLILLNGKIVGYLTINSYVSGAISPLGLKEFLISLGY